jgi:hypothetical protein
MLGNTPEKEKLEERILLFAKRNQHTPLRENHRAEEMANGKVGMFNQ